MFFTQRSWTPSRHVRRRSLGLIHLEGHVSRDPWEVVIGWDGTEPVGYAYGSPLPHRSRWWAGMLELLPEEMT
ncbi:MAG: hypothetical protein JO362_02295 [Streptomycetaceae bacterium]|nr:hypothetical protein [Streptomycetaceae bacterium]